VNMARPVAAIVGRELRRMLRQRGRLLSSMIRPLIWLLVIGGGFGSLLGHLGYDNYQRFMVPGVICMVLLFGSMLSALSLVYDKESGVMRMLVIAPFAHAWIVLARTLRAAAIGLAHALLLMIVLAALGLLQTPIHLPLLAVSMVATALLCASLGILIAVFSKTLENFAVIMNFFIFPVFFLSGALYPIEHLPPVLKWVTLVNPFSYGVDLFKHALPWAASGRSFDMDFSVSRDLLTLAAWILGAFTVACVSFSRPRLMERYARLLSSPRR